MKTIITTAFALFVTLSLCSSAGAQLTGRIGGAGQQQPKSGETGLPKAKTLEPDKPDPSVDLKRRIKLLEESLASMTPETFATVAAARTRGTELRARVDQMREHLYIPHVDAIHAERLTHLQERWGDLAAAILEGQHAGRSLSAERWARYAPAFSGVSCGDTKSLQVPPSKDVQMVGWAWTCLSDLFFKELAAIEVGEARELSEKRAIATERLEAAMRAAEQALSLLGDGHDVPRSFLARVGQLLHEVERIGTALRLKELQLLLNGGNATFPVRTMLAKSSVLRRTRNGSPMRVTLEGATVEIQIKDQFATSRLAGDLHIVHYRLAVLQLKGDTPTESRDSRERDRRSILFDMAKAAH